MTINITNSGYLAQAVKNRPVVGWHSVLSPGDISSDSDDGSTVRNAWSPDTYTAWRHTDFFIGNSIYLNLQNNSGGSVNYAAVVGVTGLPSSITLQTSTDGSSWTDVGVMPAGEMSIIYFDDNPNSFFRIRFQVGGGTVKTLGVANVRLGVALVLERPYFVGNSPNDKQVEKVVNQSDNGRYLGSTLVSVTRPYSIPQQNNTDSFVRQYVDDFLDHCELVLEGQAGPLGSFFYAWRPEEFPDDTYYCHAPSSVTRPDYQRPNKMMQWSISGVAER